MKSMFKFDTKSLVATGLGAALFTLLFMYVKVPSWVPETQLQVAYGVSVFFGTLFGPIVGGAIAFIGHFITDSLQYGAWWSWIIASGVCSFIGSMAYTSVRIEEGIFEKSDIIKFNIYQVVGNLIAWMIVAPVLDVLIYAEPVNLVIAQGCLAALLNSVSTGIVGTILLVAYSKTKVKSGSLSKEA